MKLMKELTAPIKEAAPDVDFAGYAKWKRTLQATQNSMDQLAAVLKNGSQFRKLSLQLGGDQVDLDAALQHLNQLEDAMSELEMTVGIAQQPHPDDNQ